MREFQHFAPVTVQAYPARGTQARAFRCYRSTPDCAVVQLRGVKSYATATIGVDALVEIINALQRLMDEMNVGRPSEAPP